MSSKSYNETAMEMVKLYFTCHPERLPEDKDKAFQEMAKMLAEFKNKLIDQGIRKNEDFFKDQF